MNQSLQALHKIIERHNPRRKEREQCRVQLQHYSVRLPNY